MIKVARSRNPDAAAAVAEIGASFQGMQPKVVLCFSSTVQEPHAVSTALRTHYPHSLAVGCTTAGEIGCGSFGHGGVVAMALDDEEVEQAAVVVVEDLGPHMDPRSALAALEHQLGSPLSELDVDKHMGIVLVDGLSGAEERLMEALGRETDMAFIGGSAGDDLKFEKTRIFLSGKVLDKSAVLLVLRLRKGFDIVKTQSFRPTGQVLRATKVRETDRVVLEFNHKPAVQAYAEALGVKSSEVEACFKSHPLAMMVNGSPFVRSPRAVQGTSIAFYCQIHEETELAIMQAGDIIPDTQKAVHERIVSLGGVSGALDFHCTLRAQELESRGQLEEYGKIWADLPAVGFATYGECWMYHMNQTSTIVLFK